MRYKKIKEFVETVIAPSVKFIKKNSKIRVMPFKDIEGLLKIYFPKTKYSKTGKGFFKHVYIIHSHKRTLALKVGRRKEHVRKDFITYQRMFKKTGNRYFAKIYWRSGLFMLQKYGEPVKVPIKTLERLKAVGKKCGLKDIKSANVMKFGRSFKIIDAERR